jgi:flagellar biosynthesis protein
LKERKAAPRKPRRQAVALEYADTDKLPRVLASGTDSLAAQIISLATRLGIPVTKNEELTSLLAGVQPGQQASPETFQLIAEVVSFLYHTDKEWQKEHQFLKPILEP